MPIAESGHYLVNRRQISGLDGIFLANPAPTAPPDSSDSPPPRTSYRQHWGALDTRLADPTSEIKGGRSCPCYIHAVAAIIIEPTNLQVISSDDLTATRLMFQS